MIGVGAAALVVIALVAALTNQTLTVVVAVALAGVVAALLAIGDAVENITAALDEEIEWTPTEDDWAWYLEDSYVDPMERLTEDIHADHIADERRQEGP